MDAEVKCTGASNYDLFGDVIAVSGEGEADTHAATTSRSILKFSGRSVVCWVPLGTPGRNT